MLRGASRWSASTADAVHGRDEQSFWFCHARRDSQCRFGNRIDIRQRGLCSRRRRCHEPHAGFERRDPLRPGRGSACPSAKKQLTDEDRFVLLRRHRTVTVVQLTGLEVKTVQLEYISVVWGMHRSGWRRPESDRPLADVVCCASSPPATSTWLLRDRCYATVARRFRRRKR